MTGEQTPVALGHVAAELRAISAALKDCARDTTGLMYERGPDGELRLRDYVAGADTNNPPEDCESAVWEVRGRVIALQEYLEQHPHVAAMSCHDVVELVEDLPGEGLRAGQTGTIVDVYGEPTGFEVEFCGDDGVTQALLALKPTQVRPVPDQGATPG